MKTIKCLDILPSLFPYTLCDVYCKIIIGFCLIFGFFFEKCCFLPEIFVYLLCLAIGLPLLSGLSTAWNYLAKRGRSAGAGSLAYIFTNHRWKTARAVV